MIKIEPIFLDSVEISQACKINKKRIGFFVKNYGLPAFKDAEGDNAPWKARPEALKKWAAEHEKRFIKNQCQ